MNDCIYRTFYAGLAPKLIRTAVELAWRQGWGFDIQVWRLVIYWHYGAAEANTRAAKDAEKLFHV